MGAQAGIGSTYNVMPKVIVSIYDAFMKGDLAGARAAQYKADCLIEVMLKYGCMPSLKWMLEQQGFDVGYCTYPLKRLSDAEKKALRADLDALEYEKNYL